MACVFLRYQYENVLSEKSGKLEFLRVGVEKYPAGLWLSSLKTILQTRN